MTRELIFKIDAWTPETLPMERLGEYLVQIARLYGEASSVHFRKLRKGSAVVVSAVDDTAVPKVEKRIAQARAPQAPADVVEAFRRIDDMLANDNATGVVRIARGATLIVFPGRDRPKPVDYGLVKEEGFIEGELVRIGGRDKTVHLALQDGDTALSNIVTDRETAREMGALIFGPTLRLWGSGAWRRAEDGRWSLDSFKVSRFEVLADVPAMDTVARVRAVPGNDWHLSDDPVGDLVRSRRDERPN